MSSLITYEPYIDCCTEIFCQRLGEMADAGTSFNMIHWFQCYAFDVIGMITYSKRLGFLDIGEDIGGIIEAIENMLDYGTAVGIYPSLHPLLFHIQGWCAGKSGSGREFLLNYTNEKIAEHQSNTKPGDAVLKQESEHMGTDFLTKLSDKYSKNPELFTKHHILVGCTENMTAGSDTTAITLSAILYHLLRNPTTLRKLNEDLDNFYGGQGRNSRSITFKVSQELPYLQAVIKEALRIHPATGLPLERTVPVGGAEINGYFFPEGVCYSLKTISS